MFKLKTPPYAFRSVKVDCITVSTSPVKATIDDLITKLFDTLLISLRRSIVNDYNSLDSYASKSQEDLNHVPQSVEEMGDVNDKYQKIMLEKPEVSLIRFSIYVHEIFLVFTWSVRYVFLRFVFFFSSSFLCDECYKRVLDSI